MRSEGVFGRLFSGGAVLKAAETERDEAAGRLENRYGPAGVPTLPKERTSIEHATTTEELAAAFQYRQHFDHLLGDLRTVHQGLASAEDEHQGKLMLLDELYHQRDKASERLQDRFYKVRHTLETLYSEPKKKGRKRRGFALASISGDTPRNPRRFAEQVAQTEKFLRKPAVEPPTLELDGVKVDFVTLADDLKPLREELEALLDAIDRVGKESERTLAARKKATEEFDDIFQWVTRSFESLFHLAGLHELAERIRPSVRRRGRRAVDEEDAAKDDQPKDGEPSDGQPSDEASPTEASSTEASPAEPSAKASPAESQSAPATPASPPSES